LFLPHQLKFVSSFLSNTNARWICCQLGAREHYAVPRALYGHGVLELLFTDIWLPPNILLGKLAPSLRERFHADLAAANVYAPNIRSIIQELCAKFSSLRVGPEYRSYWQGRIARNESFQRAAVARLLPIEASDMPRTVMAYSYMALEIFRLARARGWRTVLGQIDPGPPEDQILATLYEKREVDSPKHERVPQQYWADWRKECALADRIVVNSLWSKEALESEGVPAEKIRVIPLGYKIPGAAVEFERSYPSAFNESRPLRVLFLGQIVVRKGIAPLLDAIRLLKGEPLEFWFVGPVQVQIPEDLRDDPRMRWIGPVSRSNTAQFFREADIFIFPTFSDGFGLTQLEAQAWRLPIIATKFCGDVVKDGTNGWLLSEVSASAIAAMLRRCLRNPARLQELSSGSTLAEQFGLACVGKQWLRVLE
jgi:glycosyltransferase involved in cell wall biosynthesis